MPSAKNIRSSVIKKGIRRTIRTAEFESLVIEDAMEETIEWSTLSERDKKMDNWDTILLQRFQKTHDRIIKDLGFSPKHAFFHNPSDETIARLAPKIIASKESAPKESAPKESAPKESAPKTRDIDLDNLDTIG